MSADDLPDFFQRHFPIIRAKCSRMLGDSDEAADIAQETFVRLWRSPAARQPVAARAKFIYVTATRLAIDRLRHRRIVDGLSDVGAPRVAAAGTLEGAALARQALGRLASSLDAATLEALIYTRYDRMTHGEVAAVMGISARQVRRILELAEPKLQRRKELSPHDA